jgi:protein TonB
MPLDPVGRLCHDRPMAEPATRYAQTKKRLNPWVIALIALIHLGLFYLLVRALAPTAVSGVERSVVSAFTVTVSTPEEERRMREDPPAPRASSTGTANTAGATDQGQGTGRSGTGEGTGSGEGGGGQGGGAATKPVLTRAITDASAFPVPPGGRQARIGQSVIVRLTVSAQGRATRCSIYRPSPFPETDAAVCRLALDQLRFEPARDASGNPVAATFHYQQRFFN